MWADKIYLWGDNVLDKMYQKALRVDLLLYE